MKLTSSIRLKPDLIFAVPLLNLVLLLYIFFLLNSTVGMGPGIGVIELPESNSVLRPMQDPDFVTITSNEKLHFNRDVATWENLRYKVRDSTPKCNHVIINADAMVPHGVVVRLQKIILEAGREVSVATRLAK